MPKDLTILGSTGSIGRSTLEILRQHPGAYRVAALVAGWNVDELVCQVAEFRPDAVSVADERVRTELMGRLPAGRRPDVLCGAAGACELAANGTGRLVVAAMVGFAGLGPTMAAVEAGKNIALANKETLVAAGSLVIEAAARSGSRLIPVDSEHSAIFQCLQGEAPESVRRLWLTASGGPFRRTDPADLARVTPTQALQHPTWNMGPKVTIDSATMMNKGLEVIEAHWLFRLPPSAIKVVIHPQSVVHSLVEFVDGSFKAQLGEPDMRQPIQHALFHPERRARPDQPFDLCAAGPLEFERPDPERFPCLRLACQALERGGTAPAILNAANEVAVQAFLAGRIAFPDIARVIADTLDHEATQPMCDMTQLAEVDLSARRRAEWVTGTLAPGGGPS